MKKYLKNKKLTLTAILVIFLVWMIIEFYNSNLESSVVVLIFGIWLVGIVYSIYDLNRNIFFLVFLFGFFNFLIGRSILILFGIFEEVYTYTPSDSLNGQILILISITSLVIGYILFDNYLLSKNKNITNISGDKSYNSEKNNRIKFISKCLYIFTYPFLIFSVIITVAYVMKNGYLSLYVGNYVKTSFIVKKIADISVVSFYFFLATMPKKKEAKPFLFLFFIYLFLSLLTGSRFDFFIGLLIIFIYYILRNSINSEKLWFPNKYYKYLTVFLIIIVIFFTFYNFFRFGSNSIAIMKKMGPLKMVTRFSYDQGVNVNIPKRIFKYSDQIPDDRYYTTFSIYKFYNRNVSRITGKKFISGNSKFKALMTPSLADRLSYIMYPERYLNGEGGGSSYVAEVYLDFGYFGLIIANFLIVLLLFAINKMIRRNYLSFVLGIYMLMGLLKSPRAQTDLFLVKVLDPAIWICFLFIYVIYITKFDLKLKRTFRKWKMKKNN
ncbi:MAG: hypothetical protein CSB16_01375 [Clostridiales bacterium]|nr:MAG: hypothetical protein CSB16_01375 [Clostridiales bacterium]